MSTRDDTRWLSRSKPPVLVSIRPDRSAKRCLGSAATTNLPTRGVDHWLAVCELTAGHHGLIDRAALTRIGVRKPELERWVASSRLVRCAPRVWRLVGAPQSWEQQLAIGLLTLGPTAAVSHHAAAALHGFDGFEPGPVQFLVPRGRRGSRFDGDVRSSNSLRRADTVTVRGLRVTSPTRTIVDLVTEVCRDDLAAAIDSAVRMRATAPSVLRRRLEQLRGRGRYGAWVVDAVMRDVGTESRLEREFLALMRRSGLPEPETQVVFRAGRRTIARVDFFFRDQGVIVEVSGQLGHSTPTERAHDAQRRNELQDLGLDVYEFTYEQVTAAPDEVVRAVRRRLSGFTVVGSAT